MIRAPNNLDRDAAEIAVIIVNYRTSELTLSCLHAVASERLSLPNLHAIVVDGHSADGSAEHIDRAVQTSDLAAWTSLVALPINGGFGWANNQALLALLNGERPPEFVYLLNPDTLVEPGAISALVRRLRAIPAAAAAGSQLLNLDGSPSGSAFSFPTLRGEFARGARTGLISRLLAVKPDPEEIAEPREVDWVTGASVLFRAEALRRVGLFDDGFFLYHEEVELMWRLRRAGWTVVHEPSSRVAHVGGASTGVREVGSQVTVMPRRPAYWYESRRRFFARTAGAPAAAAAMALWLAGHLIFRLSRPFRRPSSRNLLAHELSDHWRYAWPRHSDRVSGVTPATASPGATPAWMTRAK